MKERAICKSLLVTVSLLTGLAVSGNALADWSWYSGFKTKIYKIFVHKKKHHNERDGALQQQIDAVAEQVGAVETKVDGVEDRVGAMGDQVGAIGDRVGAVESQVGALGDRANGVEAQVEALKAELEANGDVIDGKQEPINVTCPVGEAVVVIMPDGSTVCDSVGPGGSPTPGSTQHIVSVPPEAFVNASGGPMLNSDGTGGAFLSTPGLGTMVAPVNLPHGARIIEVAAWVFDNTKVDDLQVIFARRGNGLGAAENLVKLESFDSSVVEQLNSGVVSFEVDNATGSYHLRAFTNNWPGTRDLRIFGARITYEH